MQDPYSFTLTPLHLETIEKTPFWNPSDDAALYLHDEKEQVSGRGILYLKPSSS